MTDTIPAPHSTSDSSIRAPSSPSPPETPSEVEAPASAPPQAPSEEVVSTQSASPPPQISATSTWDPPVAPSTSIDTTDVPASETKPHDVPKSSPPPSEPPAAPPAAPSAIPSAHAAPQPKEKSARRKTRRPRRRGASSDSDGEGEHSDASFASASSASSLGSVTESEDDDDEDEDDEKEVEASIDPSSDLPSKSTSSAFVDPANHTPVGWDAAKKGEAVEEVNFGTTSSEATRGRGGATVRGRGRGGIQGSSTRDGEKEKEKGSKPRKTLEDMSPEERKRFDQKRAKKKEKFKAKREELKAAKKKAAEVKANGAAPSPAEPKVPAAAKPKAGPKGKKDDPVASLAASTSALALDDSSAPASATSPPSTSNNALPPRPRNGNREAYADRLAKDPKFVSRVGGFWTHDQRLYEAGTVGEGGYTGLRGLSDYWRGRGRGGPGDFRGRDRGGFRGRGRGGPGGPGGFGGFGPGGAAPRGGGHLSRPSWASVARGQEIVDSSPKNGGRRLEMDRVWDEEQARKSAPAPPQPAPIATPEQDAPVESNTVSETQSLPPAAAGPSRGQGGGKWGHEAYESVQAVEAMRGMGRGGFRGRGRGGRGAFPMRGGFFPNVMPRPISQNGIGSPTAQIASAAPPLSTAAPTAPASATVKTSSENTYTQPAAESLLGETSQVVTVNIPGSGIVEPLPPSAPPISTTETPPAPPAPAPSAAPAVAPSPIPPHVTGGSQPSPYTGSDSGSVPSTGQYIPPQPYLPPGIGIAPNGEYYNLANGAPVEFQPNPQAAYARPAFYPSHSQRGSFRGQPAPSQYYQAGAGAYSPDFQPSPGDSYGGQSPMYFPPGAAAAAHAQNGYADRSSSPFGNPYASQPSSLGYFAPPRSSKVSIRAPATGSARAGGSTSPTASLNAQGGGGGEVPSQGSARANATAFVPSQSGHASQRAAAQAQGGAMYYQAQAYNPYTAAGNEVYSGDGTNGGYQMSQEAMQEWMAHQAAVAAANGWQGGYGGYEEYGYQ